MDQMVLKAQQFFNSQYGGGSKLSTAPLEENGKTSWTVMYALTRALQFELGLTSLSDSFGPTTLSTLAAKYPRVDQATGNRNIIKILQAAMYCKGYNGSSISGQYDSTTQQAVVSAKTDMGVNGAFPGAGVEPKVFKAMLTMDPYVLISGGSTGVRAVQRWLNGRYVKRGDFYVIPCEGVHSRNVAKSLFYAIQYELGMADGIANGAFGPATRDGLRQRVVRVGASDIWANLFTAAMILNKRAVTFGSFTPSVSSQVIEFQRFVKLPETGIGDYATWCSLLISYGDQSRAGQACDGVTKITPERATALKRAGYRIVGRYLTGSTSGALPEKRIQPGELETIRQNGLSCFPIYQTWSRSADYFSSDAGTRDAYDAIYWAKIHGFKDGTTIYFAVDYDAMDGEVTQYIIPHFEAIDRTIKSASRFNVGIYGPRNICQRVADAGFASLSFVSDMSSGFSGNLGYPLPSNWAFDQIQTTSVGSGSSFIEIDKNIASGRDGAQSSFNPPASQVTYDVPVKAEDRPGLLRDCQAYLESIGVPEEGGFNDGDWVTFGENTTTMAFNTVMDWDWLITSLARRLGYPKALIQAPVMWEIRKWNDLDRAADLAVLSGAKDDSTTGLGQIYAWVAIEARNYCRTQGLHNDPVLSKDTDVKPVWTKLHDDNVYNLTSVAYLTIYNAFQISVAAPTMSTSGADIERLLARYNGTGDAAQKYGQKVKGLYDRLESYNILNRSILS